MAELCDPIRSPIATPPIWSSGHQLSALGYPRTQSSEPSTSTSWRELRLRVGQTHRWRGSLGYTLTHSPAVAEAHFCPGAGRRPGSPPEGAGSPGRCEQIPRGGGGDGSLHDLLRGLRAESPGRQRPRNGVVGVRPAAVLPAAVGSARDTERAAARRAVSTCRGRGGARGAGRGPERGGAGEGGAGRRVLAAGDPPSAVPVPGPARQEARPRALGGQWDPTVTSQSHFPRDVASLQRQSRLRALSGTKKSGGVPSSKRWPRSDAARAVREDNRTPPAPGTLVSPRAHPRVPASPCPT